MTDEEAETRQIGDGEYKITTTITTLPLPLTSLGGETTSSWEDIIDNQGGRKEEDRRGPRYLVVRVGLPASVS